jgi:hypothetical protein
MYPSREMAEEALLEAHAKFNYGPNQGPVNVYRCDECGYYHFTSQGVESERLRKHREEGRLDLEREANKWLSKFKRK